MKRIFVTFNAPYNKNLEDMIENTEYPLYHKLLELIRTWGNEGETATVAFTITEIDADD